MGISAVSGPAVRSAAPAEVEEKKVEAPPAPEVAVEEAPSAVRENYTKDGYEAAAPEASVAPAKAEAPPQLSVADSIKISKEFGAEKLAQIQRLVLMVQTNGLTHPDTMKALATLINDNKGELLKNLIPFAQALDDFGDALGSNVLTAGQRLWSFLKGVLGAALDASGLGAGGKALATLGKISKAVGAFDAAESMTKWGPLVTELAKNGADPEVITRFLELARKPTLLDRAKESVKSAVTGENAPPDAP